MALSFVIRPGQLHRLQTVSQPFTVTVPTVELGSLSINLPPAQLLNPRQLLRHPSSNVDTRPINFDHIHSARTAGLLTSSSTDIIPHKGTGLISLHSTQHIARRAAAGYYKVVSQSNFTPAQLILLCSGVISCIGIVIFREQRRRYQRH